MALPRGCSVFIFTCICKYLSIICISVKRLSLNVINKNNNNNNNNNDSNNNNNNNK